MSEPLVREWRFYLDDMIDAAHKVLAYTMGLDQSAFVVSGLNYDATVRNLEIIGEAATRIPDEIRDSNPQIPWHHDVRRNSEGICGAPMNHVGRNNRRALRRMPHRRTTLSSAKS